MAVFSLGVYFWTGPNVGKLLNNLYMIHFMNMYIKSVQKFLCKIKNTFLKNGQIFD